MSLLIAVCSTTFADEDVSSRHARLIERATESRTEGHAAAKQKLLERFDEQVAAFRKARRISAEVRLRAIESIESERKTFETHGTIPFSSVMRGAALEYLAAYVTGDAELAKAYDAAIAEVLRRKDDAAAKRIAERKNAAIAPRVLGYWRVKRGSWTLRSDGTVNLNGTWQLNKDKLVVKWKRFTDKCTIDETGQQCKCVNNVGYRFELSRADPPE